MDSSNYNEYRNFISSLSEDNFNDLVLSYIKEYYNTKDAYISNGPYDGGNDLIIAVDGKEIKIYAEADASKCPWGELKFPSSRPRSASRQARRRPCLPRRWRPYRADLPPD